MRPRLRALAACQGGLITRRQAITAGYSDNEIRSLTRSGGPWVLVRRGVYAERELLEELDPYEGLLRLRDLAAHLTMVRPHLMSHDSAARALRLATLRPAQDLVHVTRFGVGGSRTEEGVKHHLTRVGLLDNLVIDGMRVTGLSRTALDVAREHGFTAGVVACDAALQLGAHAADFARDLAMMAYWPEVTVARSAAEASDDGAESAGESLSRLVIEELALGPYETQFHVRAGNKVFRTDLRVGRQVFEFDGRKKFLRPEAGGVATKPLEDIVWDERMRQQDICQEGLGMSRIIWADLFGMARTRLKARLRAEYDETCARYGDQLPPRMAEFSSREKARRAGRFWRTP